MSTPIEIVRSQNAWMQRDALGNQAPFTGSQYRDALASVLRDAERFQALAKNCVGPSYHGRDWFYWNAQAENYEKTNTLAELADKLITQKP